MNKIVSHIRELIRHSSQTLRMPKLCASVSMKTTATATQSIKGADLNMEREINHEPFNNYYINP